MKSRITVEVDYNNNNQPVIQILQHASDDVRDGLVKAFTEKLGHESATCTIRCEEAPGCDEFGTNNKRWIISPVPPVVKSEPKPFEYENKLEWCPDMEGFYAYVLMMSNGKMYKGYTGGFKKRMLAHFNGFGCATTKRNRPVYIVHYEKFDTKQEAMAREKAFKTTDSSFLKNPANLNTIKP